MTFRPMQDTQNGRHNSDDLMNIQAEQNQGAAKAGLPVHETVYRSLRDMILFGELEPGQPVTIQGLTEHLQAGMTPVREALRRLTAAGALEFMGNRRIIVPVLDRSAIDQLKTARLALEPELAGRATALIKDSDIAAMKQADDRLDRAIARGDVHGYLVENYLFHSHLNEAAQAPILSGMVEGLWLRFGPSMRVVCGVMGTSSLPDLHKDLIEALESRDAERASKAMAEDVKQGMDQMLAGISDSIDTE